MKSILFACRLHFNLYPHSLRPILLASQRIPLVLLHAGWNNYSSCWPANNISEHRVVNIIFISFHCSKHAAEPRVWANLSLLRRQKRAITSDENFSLFYESYTKPIMKLSTVIFPSLASAQWNGWKVSLSSEFHRQLSKIKHRKKKLLIRTTISLSLGTASQTHSTTQQTTLESIKYECEERSESSANWLIKYIIVSVSEGKSNF